MPAARSIQGSEACRSRGHLLSLACTHLCTLQTLSLVDMFHRRCLLPDQVRASETGRARDPTDETSRQCIKDKGGDCNREEQASEGGRSGQWESSRQCIYVEGNESVDAIWPGFGNMISHVEKSSGSGRSGYRARRAGSQLRLALASTMAKCCFISRSLTLKFISESSCVRDYCVPTRTRTRTRTVTRSWTPRLGLRHGDRAAAAGPAPGPPRRRRRTGPGAWPGPGRDST